MIKRANLSICQSCLNALPKSSPAIQESSQDFLLKLSEELSFNKNENWNLTYTGCLDLCPDGKIGYLIKSGEEGISATEFTSEFTSFQDFAGQCQRNLKSIL